MTNVTSIQQLMHERNVSSPPILGQPGVLTVVAQATLGSFFGMFVLVIARILLVYDSFNGFFILYLPFLLGFAAATGVPAGLLSKACSKLAGGPLHPINRSVIGVLVMSVAWFPLWVFWFGRDTSPEVRIWMYPVILVPGMMIGLLTGSRLRPGRELVRAGEANATLLKILAGLTGLVLRVVVVLLFLASVIALVSALQVYYHAPAPPSKHVRTELILSVLLFGHLTIGVLILFVRMKFSALAILTAIAAAPLIANLWMVPKVAPLVQYIIIGYLATWAMFVLTRWRQTDVALSALNEELRYYLID